MCRSLDIVKMVQYVKDIVEDRYMREMFHKDIKRKVKQNKAFTLMEMLVVVAVMVVLLGISTLAVNSWHKSLKMTELDNYAKSIYLEAQNQLAALETEGKLASFYNGLITPGNEYESHKLTEAPSGYIGETNAWENLYYFAYNDTATSMFISDLSRANDEDAGLYLLEINPENGDVYGVFYWEADNEFISGTTSAEIYEKIKTALPVDRSQPQRKDKLIGYYGTTTITPTITVADYKLNQKVEVINDEELYVKISYDYKGRMLTYKNPGTTLDITVTVEGKTSGNTWTKKIDIKENDCVNEAEQRLETGLLLDGLRAGQEFKTITGKDEEGNTITESQRLIPGEDIAVTVETKFIQGSVAITETNTANTVNSLYQDVAKDGNDLSVSVSKVRHLRNLSVGYYALGSVSGNISINQNDNIDFAEGLYAFDLASKYVGTNPVAPEEVAGSVASISPIVNNTLFNNDTSSRNVTIDGNGYKIKNLVVYDSVQKDVSEEDDITQENTDRIETEGAGLFAQAKNVHFKNISLVDYTLKAEKRNNVGALVGNIIGGSIKNCGVYLEPYYKDASGVKHYYNQENDSEYGTVMSRHYATMYVLGGNRVGALIGNARNTQIEGCYGAVRVEGNRSIGGFAGNIKGGSISNCYASGDVNTLKDANKVIGGFIGRSNGTTITNAYASGDIYGESMLGGFIGKSTQTAFSKCNAYGKVLNLDGIGDFAKNKKAGGFVGQISGGGNEIELINNLLAADCHYLSQMDYNTSTSFTDAASESGNKSTVGLATTYAKLVMATQKAKDSYPYDGLLLYKAFPFAPVLAHHYGDWPSQYLIRASLVYYERYEDLSYGFYSVTDLTDISREEGTEDDKNYVWVLDSLKDETCVEDGYALLSMYYLDHVEYEIDQVGSNGTWAEKTHGTLDISDQYTNDPVLLRLRQQGFLEFKAYNKPESGAYSKDYTGETVKDAYTTSGMYLYQLPYDLQCTDRYNVQNFYDRLVIDKAYAVGNVKEGAEVIENEAFFYCPHFAKTAVNPGIMTINPENDNQTLENPRRVAIRSARQLNALGRTPYYWNKKGGLDTKMSFEQEVDINFSTYGSFNRNGIYEKTYCGKEFNLLAFDQEYSNRPIGEWSEEDRYAVNKTGFGSFQNDYNGNYHKIIDYCVKGTNTYLETHGKKELSNSQYVGLFGEIYKAQIQNIIMVVSDENKGNQGNYFVEGINAIDQNNAGLIIGAFTDENTGKLAVNNSNRPRTAVGALVGSEYTRGIASGNVSITADSNLENGDATSTITIYNCMASGYNIQYHFNKPVQESGKPTKHHPLGIAMGGLVGYARGNMANCAAVNDVKLVLNDGLAKDVNVRVGLDTIKEGDSIAICMGGLVGSYYYGTMSNSYSGGTIDVDDRDHTWYITRLRIGGICPGWMNAPGVQDDNVGAQVRYQNLYTYTAVDDRVWEVREEKNKADNNTLFDHFIPVVGRMRLWHLQAWFDNLKWNTYSENNDSQGSVVTEGYTYYLSSNTKMKNVRYIDRWVFVVPIWKNKTAIDGRSYQFSSNNLDVEAKTAADEYYLRMKGFDSLFNGQKPATCYGVNYTQLTELSSAKEYEFFTYDNSLLEADGIYLDDECVKVKYKDISGLSYDPASRAGANSYPYSESLSGLAYPFPAVVKGEVTKVVDGVEQTTIDYVHYGDWQTY